METLSNNSHSYTLFAFNIVKSYGTKIFKTDKAMALLSRSKSFFREILKIFNNLYHSNILPVEFSKCVDSCITSVTDKNRLLLVAQLYGVYVETMQKNNYVFPDATSGFSPFKCALNNDINQRLLFLQEVFNKKQVPSMDFNKSDAISYVEFDDSDSEACYITQMIAQLVETGKTDYSQIALYAEREEARNKICDVLKAKDIPVISRIYNEDYENLKRKINAYQNISEVCKKLLLQEFSYSDFKNINMLSRAQSEIYKSELDELLKNLLEEILTDSYAVEKIVNFQESSKKTESLFDSINKCRHLLSEQDSNLLVREFNSIKIFYEFYKDNNYASAIESVIKRFLGNFENTPLKEIVAGKIKSLNELQKFYDSILYIEPEFESFSDIMKWLQNNDVEDKNAVYLLSLSSKLPVDKTFDYIFIAGLSQNNFPGTNPSYPFISEESNIQLTKGLQMLNFDIISFLKTDELFFTIKFNELCNVASLARKKIWLTYHSYESKKIAQPCTFFKALKEYDFANYELYTRSPEDTGYVSVKHSLSGDKISQKNIVIEQGDVLKLNASSINAFQKCPRKYFYKNLLNLKEPYTFAASYGTVVHVVFELLNTKYLKNFDKNTAIELSCILFDSKQNQENEQKALSAGFKQTDIDLVKAADDLAIAEMKENFSDAVDDFSMSGGFDSPCVKAECEKSFTFSLPQIPDVVFDGRIDAILTQNDGCIKIVDYKTGRDKANTLEYAISEYGVNFKLRTGKDPSDVTTLQNAYDYQIPLYYLASQNSPELSQYKDKISELSLVYIRPKAKDNGCNEDSVKADKIEFYKEKIIENLKETVIDKIKNETEFKKSSGWACENCAYKFLCDSEDETDD
ncbi:putative uncharacterized protein [Clostridium sp. CAG:306]|nr:putative uncharacterized protein [Clostridium sp. CAG:306]